MVSQKLKWKSDFDKPVLWQNFERRGWTKGDESKINKLTQVLSLDDWNIFWANPWSVKQTFDPATGIRLNENQ